MQCIRPIKATQNSSGDIVYSSNKGIPGLVGFQFECRKCLPCRLNIAREKAVRAIHEAKMHEDNIFLTLTYDDDSLASQKLVYSDFQKFMKALRYKNPNSYIPYMVTGEYGGPPKILSNGYITKGHRPHWHAILFNYRPKDAMPKYTTDLGHPVWKSDEIHDIWKNGECEFGSVTLESAGYLARYATKKLIHGKDEEHDYHPIHKTSSRRAIGRSWIEKYWKHTFENGFIVLPNGQQSKIPRYYVDWLKKHRESDWLKYVTGDNKIKITQNAEKKARKEELDYLTTLFNRSQNASCATRALRPQTRSKIQERCSS